MKYRPHPPASAMLFGYDPVRDLAANHLARLVEAVVEETVQPERGPRSAGQPAFDPRLPIKVLVYGYATGIRSSRQLERLCVESLPYLFLTRGDTPSYRTLCTVRKEKQDLIEQVWVGLFAVGDAAGLQRMGRIVVDSTKLRANASGESVVKASEYEAVRQELQRVLAEAEVVDRREESEGYCGETQLEKSVHPDQMRDILRRVRKDLAKWKSSTQSKENAQGKATGAPPSSPAEPAAGVAEPGESGSAPSQLQGSAPVEEGLHESNTLEAAEEAASPPLQVTRKMRERIEEALETLALAQEEDLKHVSLTDGDARMMQGERDKRVRESHGFEVAVDNGLVVAGGSCQEAHDSSRLEPLVEQAREHEPPGVTAVDGDSGYYSGRALERLLAAGLDTCLPDNYTACDLHRGLPVGTEREKRDGRRGLVYEPEADQFRCSQGKVIPRKGQRQQSG